MKFTIQVTYYTALLLRVEILLITAETVTARLIASLNLFRWTYQISSGMMQTDLSYEASLKFSYINSN